MTFAPMPWGATRLPGISAKSLPGAIVVIERSGCGVPSALNCAIAWRTAEMQPGMSSRR